MIVTGESNYLAVVPARAGSKQLPGKNLAPLRGKPLLVWTIEHARAAKSSMRLVVSTDDAAIAAIALEHGAEVPQLRPAELATDDSPTEPALLHALDTLPGREEIRHVVLLQATSPIRDEGSIDAAIALYEASGADSLVSVVPAEPLQWRGDPLDPEPLYDIAHRPLRQQAAGGLARYRENGSIVICGAGGLRRTGNRLFGAIVLYVMGEHEGIDIDTAHDLWLAERFLEARDAR